MQTTNNMRITMFSVALGLILALLLPAAVTGAHGGNHSDRQAAVQAHVEEIKDEAQQKVSQRRLQGQERSQAARQTACEKREVALERVMSNMTLRTENFKSVFDKIYERVQGFYDSGQLTVSNYDELKSAADTAQAEAEVSVATLSEFSVDLDCENQNVATDVESFRASLTEVRSSMHDYRQAIVDLISSMRAVAAEENASNDDGTNEDATEPTEAENDSEESES